MKQLLDQKELAIVQIDDKLQVFVRDPVLREAIEAHEAAYGKVGFVTKEGCVPVLPPRCGGPMDPMCGCEMLVSEEELDVVKLEGKLHVVVKDPVLREKIEAHEAAHGDIRFLPEES